MASTSSKSKSIPHQKLSLTTTSLHNVVISNTSDVIYYEIITPKWEKDLTKISRLDPNTKQYDLICELVNEHDKPVSMRLYGGATRRADEFLIREESSGYVPYSSTLCLDRELNIRPSRTAKFRGKDGKMYTWRIDHDHLEVQHHSIVSPSLVYITFRGSNTRLI